MATPPTFVAEYETTVWNSNTSPDTVAVTVAAGDTLVVIGASEDGSCPLGTPTGGGLTYTLQQSVVVGSYTTVYVWTAPCPTSQTFTLSVAATGGLQFGLNALRFSGAAGIGNSAKTNVVSGGPSLALTTSGANSAIVVVNGDWTATSTARTWRAVNGVTPSAGSGEVTYAATGSYTVYGAYYSDAGTAGAKTVGLSAPTGQKYSIAAVEVLGTAGGGATVAPDGFAVPVALGSPSLVWSGSVAPDGVTAPVALGDPTAAAQSAATPDGFAVPVALGDPTVTWSGGIAPDGISVPVAIGAPIVGAASVNPDGVTVPVTLGDPSLSWTGSVSPDGISVPVALGSPIIGAPPLAPDGISVPVSLGAPSLAWSAAVSPDGITVPVAIGAPSLTIPGAVITRPDTGTITRPDTGTVVHILTVVVRLYTGTISRP